MSRIRSNTALLQRPAGAGKGEHVCRHRDPRRGTGSVRYAISVTSLRRRSVLLFLAVIGVACGDDNGKSTGPAPVNWVCGGVISHRRTGVPIGDVQVWVRSACLGTSDSTGAYRVALDGLPSAIGTIRFTKRDYSDAYGALDTAQVVRDGLRRLDVTMLLSKEDD